MHKSYVLMKGQNPNSSVNHNHLKLFITAVSKNYDVAELHAHKTKSSDETPVESSP